MKGAVEIVLVARWWRSGGLRLRETVFSGQGKIHVFLHVPSCMRLAEGDECNGTWLESREASWMQDLNMLLEFRAEGKGQLPPRVTDGGGQWNPPAPNGSTLNPSAFFLMFAVFLLSITKFLLLNRNTDPENIFSFNKYLFRISFVPGTETQQQTRQRKVIGSPPLQSGKKLQHP